MNARRRTGIIGAIGVLVAILAVGGVGLARSPQPPVSPAPDPSAPPDAVMLHVVSEDSAGQTIETWVDRASGDAIARTTDEAGNLRGAVQRRGLTLMRYTADPAMQPEHDTYLVERRVLDTGDPVLLQATSHLDVYRQGLETGMVVKLGEESFHDRPAVTARMTDVEGVLYLDPETLYLLGIRFPDGSEYTVSYPTIETLPREAVDPGVFNLSLPAADYDELYQRLSAEDLAGFDAYPVENLGPRFQDYTLEIVERYQPRRLPDGVIKPDNVYSIYHRRDADGFVTDQIQVVSQPTPTSAERADMAHAEAAGTLAPAEDVMVGGRSSRLRGTSEGMMRLEIDDGKTLVTVTARERDVVLAAGAALQPAVAAPIPFLPAIVGQPAS